jgi:hypothetical protein
MEPSTKEFMACAHRSSAVTNKQHFAPFHKSPYFRRSGMRQGLQFQDVKILYLGTTLFYDAQASQ